MTDPSLPIELAKHAHTITGASDWPMFIFMVGLMGVLFTIIQALVALLMRQYNKTLIKTIGDNHNIVMERIASHRKADSKHCKDCRDDHSTNKKDFRGAIIREFDALWDNIKVCCAASGVAPLTRKDVDGLKPEDG